MKKSLFIGQKVKDEGSKVLFAGVYMFVGNGFSNEKPRVSKWRFCYLLFLLFSFYFLLFPLVFHSLVSDYVAATPSPARENFTNVWWVECKAI